MNLGRYRKTIAALGAGPRIELLKTQVAKEMLWRAAIPRLIDAGCGFWHTGLHHLRDAFHEPIQQLAPLWFWCRPASGVGRHPSCGGQEVCGGHSAGWRRAPDTRGLAEIPTLLALADGVLLTGSPSNVHPSHFGEEVLDPSLPLDPDRDNFTCQ